MGKILDEMDKVLNELEDIDIDEPETEVDLGPSDIDPDVAAMQDIEQMGGTETGTTEDEPTEDEPTEEEPSDEEETGGWEIDPDNKQGDYIVTFDKKDVCRAGFQNDDTGEFDDMDDAQTKPNNYTVFVNNVKDKAKADEFVDKVKALGFAKVSVG